MSATGATSRRGALLIYLNDTQKNALPHLTQLTIYQGERTMFLDRMTRRNLELVESLRAGERRGSLALAAGPHAYRDGRAAAAKLGGKPHDRPRGHPDAALTPWRPSRTIT